MKALIISLMIFVSSLGCGCAIGNKMVANANILYRNSTGLWSRGRRRYIYYQRWKFMESSGFYMDKNKEVRLTFDMNGTYDITDDVIINIERI